MTRFRKDLKSISISPLKEIWTSLGIGEGENILVHSSLKRLFAWLARAGYRASLDGVLDSLIEVIGPDGTLFLPTFTLSFCNGAPFDVRRTPSEMGQLTEAARNRPDAIRSGHPIYSFCAIGPSAKALEGLENHYGLGTDSPIAMLRKLNAKIVVIDLKDLNSMTYFHHVEELCEVDYRYQKPFSGRYTDYAGKTETRTFSMNVRNLEMGVLGHLDPMGELLWEQGIYRGERSGQGHGVRIAVASEVHKSVEAVIKEGRAEGLLWRCEPGPA